MADPDFPDGGRQPLSLGQKPGTLDPPMQVVNLGCQISPLSNASTAKFVSEWPGLFQAYFLESFASTPPVSSAMEQGDCKSLPAAHVTFSMGHVQF